MPNYKFKAGDIVTCIEGNSDVVYGQDYEVVGVETYTQASWVVVKHPKYPNGLDCYGERFKLKETKQMPEFVKTEIITKKTINEVVDGRLPNGTLVSVRQTGPCVQLTIGASFENREGYWFTKNSLADLIKVLQDIHEAM